MKNKIQYGKWIFSSLLLTACLALGQDKGMSSQKGSQMPVEKKGGDMSMMEMMGKSKQSCTSTSGDLDKVMKMMQDALKSDDKTQMKAAMESAENQMVMMKGTMSQCTGMMGNMMAKKGLMDDCIMGGRVDGIAESKSNVQKDTLGYPKHYPAK